MGFALFLAFIIILVGFFSTNKRYRWFYIIAKTYRRDIRAFKAYYKILQYSKTSMKEGKTVSSEFLARAAMVPDQVAFYFEEEVWTYKRMEEFVNKTARFLHNEGFKKGDTIALLMENRPEFPGFWIGASQLGVRTALINTNLSMDPLLHCLKTVNTKAFFFTTPFVGKVMEILDKLEGMRFYEYQENANPTLCIKDCINLKQRIMETPGHRLEKQYISAEPKDPLVYIYTSGTTGLPKAALLTNIRSLVLLKSIYVLSEYRTDDIAYISLPLYHLAGGIAGVTQALISGVTCVIAKKFSASKYFEDCEKFNVTVAQYIGEICRYLLALPEDYPIKHKLRIMTGNGLRPQLWKKFVERFKIKQIYEIYAATEGISNMLNIDNKLGAIGFVPRYLKRFYPVTLIRCNENTGEPIRNEAGFCTECGVDEPGLAIGKINPKKTVTNFEGYTDKAETDKKILKSVFRKGDRYFNSGDLLMYDEFGYYYFKDRTGDTFRWKGENVSTSEVETIISGIVEYGDVVVYGVEIPNTDGRAGMAAIVEGPKFNINVLCNRLQLQLPSYAIPVFVRLIKSVEMTGTYKLLKNDLKLEGFDVNKIKDTIYFYNARIGSYTKLTPELYEDIINEKIRV